MTVDFKGGTGLAPKDIVIRTLGIDSPLKKLTLGRNAADLLAEDAEHGDEQGNLWVCLYNDIVTDELVIESGVMPRTVNTEELGPFAIYYNNGGDWKVFDLCDLNLDGVVTYEDDAVTLLSNLGKQTGATWAEGDLDGDRDVDNDDLMLMVFNSDALLEADFNYDGIVDVIDLGILAGGWQTDAGHSGGDANNDGIVDVIDLGILAGQWQQTTAGAEEMMLAPGTPGSPGTSESEWASESAGGGGMALLETSGSVSVQLVDLGSPATGLHAYQVNLISTGGDITAIDLDGDYGRGFDGVLGQKLVMGMFETPSEDMAVYLSQADYEQDSHFSFVEDDLVGMVHGPDEDSDNGTGTHLTCVVAFDEGARDTTVPLAQIVVPDGEVVYLNAEVAVDGDPGSKAVIADYAIYGDEEE